MPTYQYHCRACGHDLEAVQRFHDAPLTVCPRCEGRLRKVYSPVGIVFKGSGFYATDSARKSAGSTTAATPAPAPESAATTSVSAASPATGE